MSADGDIQVSPPPATMHLRRPSRWPSEDSAISGMKVYYSPDYVVAAHAFDTTRKARWVADSLRTAPVDGVELIAPPPVTADDPWPTRRSTSPRSGGGDPSTVRRARIPVGSGTLACRLREHRWRVRRG